MTCVVVLPSVCCVGAAVDFGTVAMGFSYGGLVRRACSSSVWSECVSGKLATPAVCFCTESYALNKSWAVPFV
jgi:hypothetical protein